MSFLLLWRPLYWDNIYTGKHSITTALALMDVGRIYVQKFLSYAKNSHQRHLQTSEIVSVCPDSKGMSYIPVSFRKIISCQYIYQLHFLEPVTKLLSNKHLSWQCQTVFHLTCAQSIGSLSFTPCPMHYG